MNSNTLNSSSSACTDRLDTRHITDRCEPEDELRLSLDSDGINIIWTVFTMTQKDIWKNRDVSPPHRFVLFSGGKILVPVLVQHEEVG